MSALSPAQIEPELPLDADALGLSSDEFDTLLGTALDAAEDNVADMIDVALETETTTEALSRSHAAEPHDLPLPDRPIQSVASVDIDTDRVGGEPVSADDYEVHETHLELLPTADRETWPTERRAITVEWTHGYAEVPPMVRKAVTRLVRARLRAIDEDGIESDSLLGDSISYEPEESVIARARGDALEADEPEYYGGAGIV
jgi:hypothetical protein